MWKTSRPQDLGPPPSDDPRGALVGITSGRSARTPAGVFLAVTLAIAVVFAVALILVVIAYVAA